MALLLGAHSMPDTASASRLALGPQPRAYHGTNFRLEALGAKVGSFFPHTR